MRFLALQAYMKLVSFERYLARGNFNALYDRVRKYPLAKPIDYSNSHVADCSTVDPSAMFAVAEQICTAIDLACIWYWKEALCLQRSAATTCLLKKYGVPAKLIIGAQPMPFKAHAWVEVYGRVVNDKPYTPEMYSVLDRC